MKDLINFHNVDDREDDEESDDEELDNEESDIGKLNDKSSDNEKFEISGSKVLISFTDKVQTPLLCEDIDCKEKNTTTDNYEKERKLKLNCLSDTLSLPDEEFVPQKQFPICNSLIDIEENKNSEVDSSSFITQPHGHYNPQLSPQSHGHNNKLERLATFNAFKNRSQSLLNAETFTKELPTAKEPAIKVRCELKEKTLSFEKLTEKLHMTSIMRKKGEQAAEIFQKAYSLCDLRNVNIKQTFSNQFEHASYDQLFLNEVEPKFYQLSYEDCSSCSSCRSKASSFHSLLYDQETASNYQIYQPTVCDVTGDEDLTLIPDRTETEPFENQLLPQEQDKTERHASINKKENIAAKHLKQGQMVLRTLKSKLKGFK